MSRSGRIPIKIPENTDVKIEDGVFHAKGKLGELANCPMCMGFHVGWFLVLLSPLTELFSFDVSLFNFVIMGSLSSGTSYILNMVFSDDGIQIAQNMRIGNEDHEE